MEADYGVLSFAAAYQARRDALPAAERGFGRVLFNAWMMARSVNPDQASGLRQDFEAWERRCGLDRASLLEATRCSPN